MTADAVQTHFAHRVTPGARLSTMPSGMVRYAFGLWITVVLPCQEFDPATLPNESEKRRTAVFRARNGHFGQPRQGCHRATDVLSNLTFLLGKAAF
jgi:hypothetical protein